MDNFIKELEKILIKDERLKSKEGNLLKNKVKELAYKNDKELIKNLLSNKESKKRFFEEIDEALVFNTNEFVNFLDYKNFLEDSYTKFKNNIGLQIGNEYLKNINNVELVWPYKDCVLEGGQTKEETKRKEIFWNETLAPNEVDRLFDPKVFTDFKRINKDGEHNLEEFKTDEKGNIKDNLLIKGNNLLALHSLKEKFRGKVKLIYIDPPYNTGNDSFKYNDRFNRSTWLTFMKNRLEIAKDFLNDYGLLFVQCDYNEQAHLKVLLDGVFGADRYINTISVKSSTPSGVKTSHADKKILKSQDFILVYKNKNIKLKPQYEKKEKWDTHYRFFIEDNESKDLISLTKKLKEVGLLDNDENLKDFDISKKENKNFYLKNGDRIVRKSTHNNEKIKKKCNKEYKDEIYVDERGYMYLNNDMLQPISKSFHPVLDGQNIKKDMGNVLCDFWSDIDFQNTQNQGNVSFPAGKKPEQLIYRIIDMTTNKGDIVLDFFLGSGTTAAVAHKMERQYIGIEQLDYGKNNPIYRLKNVINGEKSGISKAMDWKGGGNFVYLKMKKMNKKYIDKIQKINSKEKLLNLWKKIKNNGFISYKLDFEKFSNNYEKFKEADLETQKKFLLEVLDKNQLYVNYSEMKDEQYEISKKDKEINKAFYKK